MCVCVSCVCSVYVVYLLGVECVCVCVCMCVHFTCTSFQVIDGRNNTEMFAGLRLCLFVSFFVISSPESGGWSVRKRLEYETI